MKHLVFLCVLCVLCVAIAGCTARQVFYDSICKTEIGRQGAAVIANLAVDAVEDKTGIGIDPEKRKEVIDQAIDQACLWLDPGTDTDVPAEENDVPAETTREDIEITPGVAW